MVKTESEFKTIKVNKIVANSGQTRGMGVLPQLKMLGYGLFEKVAVDKDPIWPMLISDKPEERKKAASLIREHEPDIVAASESQEQYGVLQPIRVVELDDKTYDVVSGMTRVLARAFNHAESAKAPDTIDAMVMDKCKEVDVLFMGFEENNARRNESPMDMAIFFKEAKDNFKLSPKDIGARIGMSDQHVRNHIKLLSPKLEGKRMDIHTGRLSVDKALKLLDKLSKGDEVDEDTEKPSGKRARMYSVKKLETVYTAKKKPEWLDQKEWEMTIDEGVRKWLAYRLGKKYKPFTGEVLTVEEEPDTDAAEKNGTAKTFKLTIPKKKAIRLLTALGKPESEGWDDKVLADKLENIVNIAEDGQKLDDEELQKLLDKLLKHYVTGLTVVIKSAK